MELLTHALTTMKSSVLIRLATNGAANKDSVLMEYAAWKNPSAEMKSKAVNSVDQKTEEIFNVPDV